MKYLFFGKDTTNTDIAILIKPGSFKKQSLKYYYIDSQTELNLDRFMAFTLKYDSAKKVKAATAREYLSELLPELMEHGITTLLVCDAQYYAILTGQKAATNYGYIHPCIVEGYEHFNVTAGVNYQALMYNPTLEDNMKRSIAALVTHLTGGYVEPGKHIIHQALYPKTPEEIEVVLNKLLNVPEVTLDIEAASLKFWKAGIATIAFGITQHTGVAFAIDRDPDGEFGFGLRPKEISDRIKRLLVVFLMKYEGNVIYHNIAYDGKVLVYELFMSGLGDIKGMIDGIKQITKNFDDTKFIAYLATNNAVQNDISLKTLAQPFAGDYGEDVKDTTKIPIHDLLVYNLKDALSTWYVKNTYEPIMEKENQRWVYDNVMHADVRMVMQMELSGIPIDMDAVLALEKELEVVIETYDEYIQRSLIVKSYNIQRLTRNAEEATAKAKKKVYTIADSTIWEEFNPNSNLQLQGLLYDYLGYPVIRQTKSKAPSTDEKALTIIMNTTENEDHKKLVNYFLERTKATTILTNFIPAFKDAQQLPDGTYRLYGNFNSTGTQSLRFSSSDPNLTNIPVKGYWGKRVKQCFISNDKWVFCGADYDALEDKVNALLTQDPNRLKIYTQGYCGHCLRTQRYWPHLVPDIDPSSVESVNSIKAKYSDLRSKSKAPSFALQYNGTYFTLMYDCGFTEEEAKAIEANYHELYKASDHWMQELIKQARRDGYIEMAYGARIRTPILAKTMETDTELPFIAKKEMRSAGNAKTQSYCVLTKTAAIRFMDRVWESEYVYDILPAIIVHDAFYVSHTPSLKIAEWVNRNMIECMGWQELPEIKHDTIKLSAALDIFYPTWADPITIPNNASETQIRTLCQTGGKN